MRVIASIGGNLAAVIEEELGDMSRGLRAAVQRAGEGLKAELRRQTKEAGLGQGLANAWRSEVYPRPGKRTLHPAALVYSKAPILHEAFDRGAEIIPRRGRFLVIPLPDAVRLGLAAGGSPRSTGGVARSPLRKYSDLESVAGRLGARIVSAGGKGGAGRRGRGKARGGATITLLPSPRRAGALVAVYRKAPGEAGVPLFLLLPSVRLPRLLNIDAAATRAEDDLAAAVSAAIGSAA